MVILEIDDGYCRNLLFAKEIKNHFFLPRTPTPFCPLVFASYRNHHLALMAPYRYRQGLRVGIVPRHLVAAIWPLITSSVSNKAASITILSSKGLMYRRIKHDAELKASVINVSFKSPLSRDPSRSGQLSQWGGQIEVYEVRSSQGSR